MEVPDSLLAKRIESFNILRWQGRHIDALALAREIAAGHMKSALASNTLASALMTEIRILGPRAPPNLLLEAVAAYSHARTLAPNCMETVMRHCIAMAMAGSPDVAAAELKKSMITRPDDPLTHHPEIPEYAGIQKKKDRIVKLWNLVGAARVYICSQQIKTLLRENNPVELERKARELAEAESLACAHHMHAHANFHYARLCAGLMDDMTRPLLEHARDIAKKAVEKFNSSIVMCLFLAKVSCVLGDYEEAEKACYRGLKIEDPSDPKDDDAIDGIFRKEDLKLVAKRIHYVRFQLDLVLKHITKVCKAYWDSMTRLNRNRLLTIRVDSLCAYYRPTNPSVANTLSEAVLFFMKNQSWKIWNCPVAKCNKNFQKGYYLGNHLFTSHKDKMIRTPPNLECEDSSVELCRIYACQVNGHNVLQTKATNSQYMFSMFPLWPEKASKPFKEVLHTKRNEGNNILMEVKKTMKALPADTSGNEFNEANSALKRLWLQFLEVSVVDYEEFILPFVIKYQWSELTRRMASDKDISGRTIGREDIALIFEGVPGEPGTKVPLRNRPSSTNKMEHQSGDTIQTENMKVDEDVQENVFLEYLCISEDGQGSSDPSVNLDEKGKIPAEKLAPEQADLNESRVVSISAPQTATSCNRKPVPDADPVAIAPNWNPIVLQHKDNQVETTNTKLTMFDKEVPVMNAKSQLPKFYHASMTGDQSSSSTISCIVGPRLPIEVMEHSFKFMVSCRHPNILKPFGVWNFDDGTGLITFPVLDGTISKIPRSELFVEHGGILSDFTEEGHRVMRDISCAVHYVNMHYGREEACTGPGGPRAAGQYHVLLGDTERHTHVCPDVTVDEVIRANWNSLGDSVEVLHEGNSIDLELAHLITVLKGPTVSYEDLLWEPGLWDATTKMEFIREIFGLLDTDPHKNNQLETKRALGLKTLISKLGYPTPQQETNLHHDVTFLRHKIVAHQDCPYARYPGPKEDIGDDNATIERFVRQEVPGYMLALVEEIRHLGWIKESPLLRGRTGSMKWLPVGSESTLN